MERRGELDTATNLQELADRLSDLLGNPITIEGADFELIAHSRQAHAVDGIRKTTILERRVPDAVVRALWSSGVVNHLHSSTKAVRVPNLDSVGLAGRVAVAVRMGDDVRAHIWVQETNRELKDEDLLLLQHAADLAAIELLKIGHHRETRDRMVSDFLSELLTSPAVHEADARARASRLGYSLPDSYRVVIADIDDFRDAGGEADAGDIERLQREIVRLANDEAFRLRVPALAVRQSGTVVMIASVVDQPRGEQLRLPRAICDAALKRGHRLLVSASHAYEGFSRVPEAYQEAMRCLAVARAIGWRNAVVSQELIGVLQFLPLMKQAYEARPGGLGIHAKLARLMEEDRKQKRGFSLVETLEAFLDCGCDTQRAAERLFVHVNTLNYRLRRIAERTALDLSDGLERLAVHLELKLLRLAGGTG